MPLPLGTGLGFWAESGIIHRGAVGVEQHPGPHPLDARSSPV